MTSSVIKTVVFSAELQREFAELSGDCNPIHMSSLAARRTQAGRPVVHGIHIVLSALDSVAASSPGLPLPSSLAVRFMKPVYPDEVVEFHRVGQSNADLCIQAVADGITTAELRMVLSELFPAHQKARPFDKQGSAVCRELMLEDMAGRSGAVGLSATEEDIAGRFPNAVRWLGTETVGGLLCLSRLVGMECPGLHSLFAGFVIEFPATDTSSSLEYRVASVDSRFRLMKIDVNGMGLRGRVEAFVRQPPAAQMSISDLSSVVSPSEFEGQRALVIGGSRGLGEFTAKALAAGGGAPIVTYATGNDDAERVVEEIKQWGGNCDSLKYDIHMPSAQQLKSVVPPVSYLYYYATGQIFRRHGKRFDSALLDDFLKFYVAGFYDVCVALREMSEPGLSAFYPSSVAVADRPRDLTEYAMAKAAGEVLCSDLNQFWPSMHIMSVRLPRLSTDQTAAMVSTETANSLDVILPIIRKVQAICF